MLMLDMLLAKTWEKPWGVTQWLLVWIVGLCSLGLLLLFRLAAMAGVAPPGLAAWAFLSSLAAFLGGGVLGLLFGLPSVPVGRTAAGPGPAPTGTASVSDDQADPAASRYAESTSLEQVADWLTKIIVGLTLTRFHNWSIRFHDLSGEVTAGLLCPASPNGCGVVPGGALISAFSLAGFLFTYLWMRRFFIKEMVTRDTELADLVRRRQQDAKKEERVQRPDGGGGWLANRIAGVLGMGSGTPQANTPLILADGIAKAVNGAKAVAARIGAGADPDDPWRGAFGGQPSDGHAVLSASVVPLPNDPRNCLIDITVTGITPADQKGLASRSLLFYLHPTFGPTVKTATFGGDGRARLTLYGYGAFTIGALLEDGTTLELDLAELPGIPEAFRNG